LLALSLLSLVLLPFALPEPFRVFLEPLPWYSVPLWKTPPFAIGVDTRLGVVIVVLFMVVILFLVVIVVRARSFLVCIVFDLSLLAAVISTVISVVVSVVVPVVVAPAGGGVSGADGRGIWTVLASSGREGRSGWHETCRC
jgi:hypothetical protein